MARATATGNREAPSAGAASTSETGGRLPAWAEVVLRRYTVVLVLVAMTVVFSVLRPYTFATAGNFQTIANSQSVLLILALGLTLPLSTGEFDLSIASGLGFAAILIGYLCGILHWSLLPAVLVILADGVLIGAINGLFVVRFGVNAFIVTLGTSTVLTGLTLAVSGGQVLNGVPASLSSFATYALAGLAIPVYIALALALLLWYVYEHTPLGRHITFIGFGREVARLAGLRVDALRAGAFIVSSVIAAGCGILAAGQLGAADPSAGPGYLLPAFAAAFLGTTTIRPGRFNAWGTVVALAFLEIGVTGLELLGAASWVEDVFNGAALIIAVTFARLVSRTLD